MRTLGILGGMAWPSTAAAYRQINEGVAARLGGVHSAPLIVYSPDFHEIELLQSAGEWEQAGKLLGDAGCALVAAGAQGLMLCTNTMHVVADQIEELAGVELLHIADATARRIREADIEQVGLLGTAYTMEGDFYAGRMRERGLGVIVPDAAQRQEVHRIIYEELVFNEINPTSRQTYLDVVTGLIERGVQGIIAGCTEIELLLTARDVGVPYFPTTRIHSDAAIDWILS